MIYQWYHWQQKNFQGFLVTIGKNGTNSTIGRFADFTIGRTPNVACYSNRQECLKLLAFVACIVSLGVNLIFQNIKLLRMKVTAHVGLSVKQGAPWNIYYTITGKNQIDVRFKN